MKFKLTPEHRWYVNANGDRCEAALLNGAWVAVWDNGNITRHSGDGRCTFSRLYANHSLIEDHHITARFTGWLSDPFEGQPTEYKFAIYADCVILKGHSELEREIESCFLCINEPKQKDGAFLVEEPTERNGFIYSPAKYQGDWRNSLVERKE